MNLDILLGLQFGDEGKGKITDFLAEKYDVIARFAGGNNAGHTVIIGNKIFKLHLLPSGIVRPDKSNVLGNNMVINPIGLVEEIEALRKEGISISTENLIISNLATLILPIYPLMDISNEKQLGMGKIGTTGKGIGLAYEDKSARRALKMHDIFEDSFREKIDNLYKIHKTKVEDLDTIETSKNVFLKACEEIKPYIKCLFDFLHDSEYNILAEGAQGSFLDINYGTYPMVTSSDVTSMGALSGLGINHRYVNNIIGVAKAFQSRVGSGAFPTEIFDKDIVDILRGDGKTLGDEYGTTTGRPRRIGWLDLPMLKYANMLNGTNHMYITKMDILSKLDIIKVCVGYENYDSRIYDFYNGIAETYKPIYIELSGWNSDISKITNYNSLPNKAREYIDLIEDFTKTTVKAISTGVERSNIIELF